jgi:hypothetical protein
MGLGYAVVSQEQRHGLRGHDWAAVGVDRELSAVDALPGTRFTDQPLGQLGALTVGYHPADHVPTEDIEDD